MSQACGYPRRLIENYREMGYSIQIVGNDPLLP